MKLLVTGASGYVGGFILADAARGGDEVISLSRSKPKNGLAWHPFDLGAPLKRLPAADALIHCAFDHVREKYRGGEGEDPAGFMARNYDGSLALFAAAQRVGVKRIVFLSSRAVYDGADEGAVLTENMPLAPTSLYGQLKYKLEQALASLEGLTTTSLRATGVYGAARHGAYHKWVALLAQFEAGEPIPARCGTEVHGADLAAAVRLILTAPQEAIDKQVFNVSDILLDRRNLLARYAALKGLNLPLPALSEARPNEMDCSSLRALGWTPRGAAGLGAFLESLD